MYLRVPQDARLPLQARANHVPSLRDHFIPRLSSIISAGSQLAHCIRLSLSVNTRQCIINEIFDA